MDNLNYNDTDLANDWQKLMDQKFNETTINKESIMEAITQESKSNIAELKRRLKFKIYWSVFFTIIFGIGLLFSLHNTDLSILLGIIIGAYVLGSLAMFIKYRQIPDNDTHEENILQSLKKNLSVIKSVLNFENIWGAIVYAPIIFIAILGGKVLKGTSISESLSDPKILLITIITIIIITPLLIWLTNKMNKYAFGNLIKDLENSIIKMETLS